MIAVITIGVIGLLASGAWLQHRLGNDAPTVNTLHLPADLCPPPEPGKALAIVVYPPDSSSVRLARCRLVISKEPS